MNPAAIVCIPTTPQGNMPISLAEKFPGTVDTPPCYDTDKAWEEFNALTPEQKGRLSIGIAIAASSNEADKEFIKASAAAATAVQSIETLFITLTVKLNRIVEAPVFSKDFAAIQGIFRNVVKDSRHLAVTISQYIDSFDTIIVKFCADKELSVKMRVAKIKEFIAKADSFKEDAGKMRDRFTQLKDQFATFVSSFSSWSKEREGEDEQKIRDIYEKIGELNKKITAIDSAMSILCASLGATIPITGLLVIALPPAAPWIIITGATIAGLKLGSLIGLVIAKNALVNRKRDQENKIRDLQNEITKTKATRTQLEKDGQVALDTFINNISLIQNVWINVVSDATAIHGWLQNGADYAQTPKYMKLALEKGVQVYSKMGKYLKDYADGVTETVKSFRE